MAVSDSQNINLAPYFSNIVDLIRQQAEMQRNPPPSFSQQLGADIGQNLSQGISSGIQSGIQSKQQERLSKLQSDLALDRSKKLAKFEKEISKELSPEEKSALDSLRQNIGQPGYPTQAQFDAIILGGKDVIKVFAQSQFPKPTAGRKTVRLEDPNGIVREIPVDLVNENIDWTSFPWNQYPPAGYKPTTTKSGRTGEIINVTATGKTREITGPENKPKDQPLRNDISQLNTKERTLIEKASEDVDQDKVIQKLRESRINLEAVKKIAESNNPAGVAILPFRVIRGVGLEVGTLARQDVEAGGGSQELWRRAQRKASIWAEGKLPPEDIKDFIELANIANSVNQKELKTETDKYINRTIGKFEKQDVDPGLIRRAITKEDIPVERVRMQRPNGSFSRVPKDQVEAAIARGYKLAE